MTRHLQSTTVRRLCPAFFARITNRRRPPGASPGAPFARIKLICIKLIPKTRGQPYYRNAFRVSARSSRPGGLFLLDSLVWAGRHWGPPSGPVRASAGAPASAPLARARPSGVCARASGGMRPGPARLAPVRPSLRRPGLRRGPLSAARAARRGVRSAPCGGRRGLVPAPPPPRGPSRARPGRWRRGPPSGAWPGACPGLVPPRAPHPAAGWGPWPRRRVAVTAGPCS